MDFFKKRFYLFILERGEGREKESKRNINVWLPFTCPQVGTWPTTQACALTGNQTSDPLIHRLELNPLSHTSRGCTQSFINKIPGNVRVGRMTTIWLALRLIFFIITAPWQLNISVGVWFDKWAVKTFGDSGTERELQSSKRKE